MTIQSLQPIGRRSFLRHASVFALAVPLVELGALSLLGCGRQVQSAVQAPKQPSMEKASARITLVSDKEPGEPLIVSGTIYAPDGHTPLEGISLYVYQTDATGIYSTSGVAGSNRNTRIHGLITTGPDGRYEFRTIRPGAYPGRQIASHIHAYVSGAGYPEYWIDEYVFASDSLLGEDVKQKFQGLANFSPVLNLTRGTDGVWRGVRDIKVERCTNNCTKS
ncbi:MAG: protocatechuate 3,4-dioxygenase [bacterium]